MLNRRFVFDKVNNGKDFVFSGARVGKNLVFNNTQRGADFVISTATIGTDFVISRAKNDTIFIIKGTNWFAQEVLSLLPFKFLFRFPYPKLGLFILCIILSYYIFTDSLLAGFLSHLQGWSYLGVFFAGILFSFGFTSPFSAGLLILMKPDNIFIAALIGGIGCLIGDMLIFKFVKISFENEFKRLRKERPFRFVRMKLKKVIAPKLWHYLIFAMAAFFFASPFLPDEAAVTLLAGIGSIDIKKLAIISFCCNTIGILFLLAI